MNIRSIILAALFLIPSLVHALAPPENEQAPTSATPVQASTSTIEVNNNSGITVVVAQKGSEQQSLPSSGTLNMPDYQKNVLSIRLETRLDQDITVTASRDHCGETLCLVLPLERTEVEFVNNGKLTVSVFQDVAIDLRKATESEAQRGVELRNKEKVRMTDVATASVRVRPAGTQDSINYVTITGKQGACAAPTCVFVQ